MFKYRKGMKFKSLTTNEYRTKGQIYTITRNSSYKCWYLTDDFKELCITHIITIELYKYNPITEIEFLDCFQQNFREE